MTPLEAYQKHLNQNEFQEDTAQARGVELTQALYEKLLQTDSAKSQNKLFSFFTKTKTQNIQGLYFWGGVGRGKSMIIDSFFDCLPFTQKRRIHFNHFMQAIHRQLRILPKTPDPIKVIAKDLAEKYRLICIDEFHVDDITDAMIMAGFLEAIFNEGIILVTTSNIEPDQLYKNGLQRDRFLPAIELIKMHTVVFHLASETDYRLQLLEQQGTYHVVAPYQSAEIMESYLTKLANTKIERNLMIEINDREIRCRAVTENQIWFEFSDICQTPRSSSDYIHLTQEYQTIMVSNIPAMTDGQNDVVQRFIQFIDAVYDHNVKFIATALAEPNELYSGDSLKFPFERTISRLHEMRSDSYLAKPHTAD